MKPRDARTLDEIRALEIDNVVIEIGPYSLMLDEQDATLAQEVLEDSALAGVTIPIPREIFNQLVDWYNAGIRKG